jgi:hypothetical protein
MHTWKAWLGEIVGEAPLEVGFPSLRVMARIHSLVLTFLCTVLEGCVVCAAFDVTVSTPLYTLQNGQLKGQLWKSLPSVGASAACSTSMICFCTSMLSDMPCVCPPN